jgi:hypothetical protein
MCRNGTENNRGAGERKEYRREEKEKKKWKGKGMEMEMG